MLSIEYVAGLLDGEGCIGIYKRKPLRKGDSTVCQLHVDIGNSHLGVLVEIQKQFGGSIRKHISHLGYKPAYCWVLATKAAAKFLSLVYPYLIIKREQARLGIEFHQTKTYRLGVKLTKSELSMREAYYQMMHSLNQK